MHIVRFDQRTLFEVQTSEAKWRCRLKRQKLPGIVSLYRVSSVLRIQCHNQLQLQKQAATRILEGKITLFCFYSSKQCYKFLVR